MKATNHLSAFFISCACLLISGCISVGLPAKKAVRAEGYTFEEPKSPFQKLNDADIDLHWESKTTGNAIVVMTDCSKAADVPLEQMETDSMAALNDVAVQSSASFTYNARGARETEAVGFLDGVKARIRVLTFKKSSCSYTLSYFGKDSTFNSEKAQFEKFKTGFRAP